MRDTYQYQLVPLLVGMMFQRTLGSRGPRVFPVQGPSLRVAWESISIAPSLQCSGKCGQGLTRRAQVGSTVPVDDEVLDSLRSADACRNDLPLVILGPSGSALLCMSFRTDEKVVQLRVRTRRSLGYHRPFCRCRERRGKLRRRRSR